MNPSSQASKTLGTPSSSSSDGAGARPGAVEENLQTSWSAASQSPQPPRPQPQLPAWRQLCEARSTTMFLELVFSQSAPVTWPISWNFLDTDEVQPPNDCDCLFDSKVFLRPSSHLEPSSSRRASLFYTANLGTPKNGPDAICRLVLYLPLGRFSSSACSWAFPDDDVYRSQGRWVMSHLRILRILILIFPSLMGSSHPFPNAIPGPFQSEHRLALRDGMLLLSSVDSDLGDQDRRIMKSWRI